MPTKQQIKNFLSENIVCVLVAHTMILLFLKVLLFLVVYPTVYSTRFIFENWYKWFPRKYDPRKDIKEGVDFRNTPQQMSKEFLLDRLNFANFSGMNLTGHVFRNCYADSVNFSGADLTQAGFLNTNLCFADFRDANLTGCAFSQCDGISTARFSDPKEKGLVSGALAKAVKIEALLSFILETFDFSKAKLNFGVENGMMVMLFDVNTKTKTFSFTCPATGEIYRDLPLWLIHGTFVAVTSENPSKD